MVRGLPLIGVQAIHPLLGLLRASGVELSDFLSAFGLTTELVEDPDCRIPLALLDPLWQRASELAGDCDFGLHAAEAVQASSFGILSYLGVTSPNWRTGLDRVCSYFRIFSDASEYQLAIDRDAARVTAHHGVPTPGPVRHRVEFTLAVLACYGRSLVVGAWGLDEVWLEHPAPETCTEHVRIFGCAPRFSAAGSGFRFAAALLDCPLRSGDPGLHRILQRQADQTLAAIAPAHSVRSAVHDAVLRGGFAADLSLAEVARQIGTSARTLQRRLAEEGTTLGRLIDDARRATALELLARRELAVSEVAFALGFSEPAAFYHAFKRWTGATPVEFRRAGAPR